MKLLNRFTCIALASVVAMATEIPSYQVRLTTAADGSAKGLATVQLKACAPGLMNLPLGFTTVEQLRLESAPQGVRMERGPSNGQSLLHFFLPEGMPSAATIRFSFTIPFVFYTPEAGLGEKRTIPQASRLFRHAFVNTQEESIGCYRLELLFPEGMMAQAIREQLPKPKKSEVGPRVLLAKLEERQAAILQLSGLKQGDDTAMTLELVPNRKSLGWLLAGIVIAGLYLYHFRDIVARKSA